MMLNNKNQKMMLNNKNQKMMNVFWKLVHSLLIIIYELIISKLFIFWFLLEDIYIGVGSEDLYTGVWLVSIIPVKFYSNPETEKKEIIKENKNKSGVYRWINEKNGKFYVGSSINLGNRLRDYYNISFLSRPNSQGMIISRSLLKYGYSNFKLEILEYCNKEDVIIREQFYIDLLKPEYNILKTAASSFGYKHSEKKLI